MVAQQCCWLVRDPVMLSDCLLIRNPNNTFLNEFAFVMSCHCVSRFLAVGGACLCILWLGNRVLHDSQHSQFGNFILIAFFSDYHVGNAGPLIAYAVSWVLCIHFMCCRLISSVIEISMTLSLSGLVFFIQVLLSSDCPLGCVGLWTGYEARSGSSYPLPLLIVWDPELARQSGGILQIGMWVVSTTFLLTRAFYSSLFLVVSGKAFFYDHYNFVPEHIEDMCISFSFWFYYPFYFTYFFISVVYNWASNLSSKLSICSFLSRG